MSMLSISIFLYSVPIKNIRKKLSNDKTGSRKNAL